MPAHTIIASVVFQDSDRPAGNGKNLRISNSAAQARTNPANARIGTRPAAAILSGRRLRQRNPGEKLKEG